LYVELLPDAVLSVCLLRMLYGAPVWR
jgi:hypothetical protein